MTKKTTAKASKTTKNKGGRRKIELTKEEIAKVEELAANLTIEQIADYFGIGERTFREIKGRDPAVAAAYKKGKSKSIDYVAGKLRYLIDSGDTTATIFYLKTQAGWNDKQVVENITNQLPSVHAKKRELRK